MRFGDDLVNCDLVWLGVAIWWAAIRWRLGGLRFGGDLVECDLEERDLVAIK